jgi:hypothetical protein
MQKAQAQQRPPKTYTISAPKEGCPAGCGHGDFQTQAADARTIFLGLAGSAKSHSGSQRQKRSALKANP